MIQCTDTYVADRYVREHCVAMVMNMDGVACTMYVGDCGVYRVYVGMVIRKTIAV